MDNSTLHSKINERKCSGNSPILSKQIIQFKTIIHILEGRICRIICEQHGKHPSLPNFRDSLLLNAADYPLASQSDWKFCKFEFQIGLTFSECIRKKCDEYPSARISKPKQLDVFNILVLFMIAPQLLYFLTTFQCFLQVCLNIS